MKVERFSYTDARKRGAWCLLGIVAGLLLCAALAFVCVPRAHAQVSTTNTFNVYSFRNSAAANVGAMTTAAQAQCVNGVPCIIVFDPILANFPTGTMPSKCAGCLWVDYRTPGAIGGQTFSNFANAQFYASAYASGSFTGGIQEAVNACPATGCTVYLPCGATTVSATVTVATAVSFQGCNRDGTTLTDTRTTGDTFAVNVSRVSFHDFTCSRSGTATAGSCFNVSSVNDVVIRNVHVTKQFNGLVSTNGCNYLYLEDNLFDGQVNDGADIECGASQQSHNKFYFNAANGETVTQGGSFILSDGNDYFGNKGHAYQAFGNSTGQDFHSNDIFDSNGSDAAIWQNYKEVHCSGCWFASSGVGFSGQNPVYTSYLGKVGMLVDSSDNEAHCVGCWFINNGANGFFAQGTPRVSLVGSFAAGNNQAGSTAAGISITDNGGSKWVSVSLIGNKAWDEYGLANPAQHQQTGLSLSGGAGGQLQIVGGDYTGNTVSAISDSSAATKTYLGAAGIGDRFSSFLQMGTVVFAGLGTPANGTVVFCSNCTIANPCATGGTGAFAKRLNSVWVCN